MSYKDKEKEREWRRNYKKLHIEKIRLKDKLFARKKRKEEPNKHRLYSKKYRDDNPEKNKAHQTVYKAIKKGLIKKGKCRDCDRLDTHGHHIDYNKRLCVIWLCPIHHKIEHLKMSLSAHPEQNYW